MSVPALRQVSLEDYLAFEHESPTRHEYVGGVIYGTTGGSRQHSRISGRILYTVFAAAEAAGCEVHASDMKLRVADAVYYPDIFVTCDPGGDAYVETSACLVVEILSPSTARIDRSEKLAAHTSMPSLLTYLIVDPDRPAIEVHSRAGSGWPTRLVGPSERISLTCPAVTLDIDALYAGLVD